MRKMKGRKPYPFEQIKANNDKIRKTQAQLELRSREPRIKSNELSCPEHLCDEVKKEWQRIVSLYQELNGDFICDLDINAIEIYCEALLTYRKAMKKVRETSEVIAQDGRPKKNPWMTIANEASITIKRYGEALLLEPVGRARSVIANKDDKKPVNKFDKFGGGGMSG
ncbi:MAG: phage terminase small subunit P27 family [Clostridia bacterium]